jgi:fatty acid desaturase
MEFDPRTIVRAALFALLGLLGLVSMIIAPWTGVVLILVAGTGVAYTLLPWETWLPGKQ